MLSRLAQGVNSVLQELSGEESPEAGAEDGLTPRTPAEGDGTSAVPGDEEDAMERLAQMEQLVVQLKEMIREKDGQLISAEKQLKEEKEAGEMRLAKLKLQAKAKVAVLSKQVSELKGQDGAGSQSPDNSFTMAPVLEEELQQLRLHLQEEESVSRALREQLEASERGAHEAEEKYTEQLRAMQAVVCEKDIRFREQVQKHEEELLKVSAQVQSDGALQQALRVAQRRTEELEEALHSRSQVLDILQQELNSADQQKQILTTQFRQMEQELAETRRRQEEERQQWAQEASRTQAEMASLTQSLEAAHREREEGAGKENKAVAEMEAELGALKERLEAVRREKDEMGAEAELRGAELAELKSRLEAAETKTGEVEGRMKTEAEHRVAQLTDLRARLEAVEAEREGVVKRMETEAEQRAEELTDLKTRLEAAEAEKVEVEKKMEAEAEQKGVELAELKSRLEASEAKRREVEERVEVEVEHREAELSDLRLRLEASEAEREGVVKRMEAEAEVRGAELPELRVRLEATKAESEEVRQGIDEALGMMEGEPAALRGTDREAQQTLLLTELWKGLCALADGEADGLGEEPLVPRDSAQCGAVLRALEARLLRLGTTELHQQASLTMDTLQGEPEGAESETHIQQSLQPIDTLQDVGQSSRAPVNQAHLEEEAVEASDLPEMGSDGEGGSALSRSVCTEGSPELISLQPESSEEREMKGTSSDEMVTSTDSEVAQSSWTLLEAGNQEGVLDWNSSLQDFDQLAHQPWEQTSEGPGLLTASSLHLQSSSVVIHESVHVTVTQQDDQTAGQAFAQALAQELQNKYSELMAELQLLREEASDSRVRVQRLQEEEQVLRVAKEAAEARVREFEEALQAARAELYEVAQQRSSHMESQNVENCMLQEQLCSLQTAACCKDQKIEALQADMDRAQHYIAEQESKFGILNAQLDEKNQAVSELEQKLKDSEAQLQDLEDLTLCLSKKEQEMMELNNAMSAKLLQAGEEKFLVSSEVANLKHQVLGLKSAMEEQIGRGSASEDELRSLQKEKQDLSSQVTAMKKEGELMKRKLQAALVQRKELMKKVEAFEKEAESIKEQGEASEERSFLDISGTDAKEEKEQERNRELLKLETALEEANQKLKAKEESLEMLEQKIAEKDKTLTEMFTENQRQIEEADNAKSQLCNDERLSREETGQEKALLQSQLSALESEHDTLQKKLQEALESRKETIRKAKEKDRRHREQLKQQKEEYNGLLGRFEEQGMERDRLLIQLKELEEMKAQNMQVNLGKEPEPEPQKEATEKPVQQSGGDWCQEDWVDFAAPESGSDPQKSSPDTQPSLSGVSEAGDDTLKPLGEEVQAEQAARLELERQLQYSQKCLALRESELLELSKELELLREKEWQINTLTLEITDLREKCRQAETQAEMLRAEVEAATALETGGGRDGLESPITQLQAEVEEFRQFLSCKNNEILELSQQLSEQNSLLQVMQETVSEKDQVIISLQENLRAEKEKSQKLEAKEEGRKEEEKIDESRLQQLQRKLQAALISRKDVLKENKLQKDGITLLEKEKAELQTRLEAGEAELVKLRMEREKLIAEVDKTLLENQGLGASCESLKLAMEGVLTEKEEYKKEVTLAKEQVAQVAREWEERVQGMKEEYETLLKSYENVSDEAERVQRVLEAARQERQDLVVKMRAHEVARKEAERLAEEARKEVETTKDKMRKFAKAKQQKIMDLEEENEKLREKEERSAGVEYMKQKEELDRAKEELETLRADLDSTRSERDLLVQESAELRQKLAQEMEKGITHNAVGSSDTEASVEEAVTAQQSSIVWTEASQELKSQTQKHETGTLVLDSALVKSEMETSETTKDGMQMRIDADKELRRVQEDELKEQLASLEQQLEEKNMNEESLRDERAKWEVKYQEVQARLEAEKDDLEEQLMNQMAQLNGSIAGYQQEAADGRERLVELQRSLEKLESERAEFEAQAKSERDRAARLEEDKRQAQRERAEAEAEAGRQRELEQKLKSAQRGKEGSQSRARQLEELLREKQLEVRQMQKDCIKYQEKISEQEKEAKALQMVRDEAKRELSASCVEATKATEELKKVEAELSTCRIRLDDALSEVGRAEAEKRAAEERSARREAESRAEAERTLDAVRLRLGAELKQTERIAEDLQREREREEQAALEARQLAESRERQAQEMQSRLHESLARLAAFSRSMSSLQDDRDRVLDEARQWESRFHSVLQGKEAEVREAETRARDLGERLQKETARREELLLALERMQKSEADWQRRCEEQEGTHEESLSALENQREALQEALTQVEESLAQKSSSLTSLEAEAEGLRHRAQALEGAVGDLQQEVEEAQAELRERQAEERRLALSLEQLETDLRSSKKLTETLQAELEGKEKREVELLGEKELAVAQAADEARQEAEGRAQEAEKELERWREEARGLEEQARMADEESSRSKARLEAFTKAMGSLQDDRDRVLGQYKQLEERHLQVIVEKDSLIQEAAAESNSMKEQLRGLLVQTDDLNAEKAKLSAQLHRYRDDLTSVLSMKDSQQKQLLAAQMERIAALERERSEMQGKIQEEGGRVERETPSQAAGDDRREGAAVVEKLREQLEASQKQVVALEEALCAEREGNKDQSKELNELRWEGGVLRTQAETAEERVAELARDLVEMEQKLLEERDASSQLQAENQSFGQAMASLQDSRDQALNEAQELRLRLEETGRMAVQPLLPSPPAGASGEVWALKNALSALQNDRERLLEQLNLQGSEMSRLRQEAAEMARVMEEKRKAEEALQREERMGRERSEEEQKMLREIQEKEEQLEVLRLERQEWQAQAEVLKEQTMAALIERDEQVQHLSAVLEEARAVQPRVSEEQYQREASSRTDVSSEGQVLPADSGQLSSQLNDTLRELHSKEVKITELSSKLSQVYDEKRQLAAQLRGSTQRLGDSQSRCGALQRQLQELQEDKRKGMQEVDSAPGAPQERSEPSGGREYRAELKELQRRLDEEQEQRLAVEEQLSAMQDRLKRQTLSEWRPGHDGNFSETAVLIEPPEGAVTQTRSSSPGLSRILRVAFCSRQRTPLLATLYLLTVHVLLLLCLGGYL